MARMKFQPRTILLLFSTTLSIALWPVSAHAQEAYGVHENARYTFSPFIGARIGGRINVNTPNVDYLPIDSSLNWGFNFGAHIVDHLFGEFMWNRQTTTLTAHHTAGGTETTLTNNAHLDMYQASLLYEFPTYSRVAPFVVGGVGFTYFDSHGVLNFNYRGSYNLGGGVKYLLAPQVAVRSELRWSPSRTTSSSAVFCDPFSRLLHDSNQQPCGAVAGKYWI